MRNLLRREREIKKKLRKNLEESIKDENNKNKEDEEEDDSSNKNYIDFVNKTRRYVSKDISREETERRKGGLRGGYNQIL